jgi:K+-sensing histidine kinase KdpD
VELPADPTDYKSLLSFMMHELRRIQGVLGQHASDLLIAVKGEKPDAERIRLLSPLLVEEIFVLHNWLSLADFYLDPDQFAKEPRKVVNLFGVFYRVKQGLARRAKTKSVTIEMRDTREYAIAAHPIIGIVPYLILDNALKYAPKSSHVTVKFEETGTAIAVRVNSMGPRVLPEEVPNILEPGVRGRNAEFLNVGGSGQGLALLNAICKYHEALVTITVGDRVLSLNGVDYSNFELALTFKKRPASA